MVNDSSNEKDKVQEKLDTAQGINGIAMQSEDELNQVLKNQRRRHEIAVRMLNDKIKASNDQAIKVSDIEEELKRTSKEITDRARKTLIYKLGEMAITSLELNEKIDIDVLKSRIDKKIWDRYQSNKEALDKLVK